MKKIYIYKFCCDIQKDKGFL